MLASILNLLRVQNTKHMHTQEPKLHFTAGIASASCSHSNTIKVLLAICELYCLSLPGLRDHLSAFHTANLGAVLLTVPCFTSEGLMWQNRGQAAAGTRGLGAPPCGPVDRLGARRPHRGFTNARQLRRLFWFYLW